MMILMQVDLSATPFLLNFHIKKSVKGVGLKLDQNISSLPPVRASSTSDSKPSSVWDTNDRAVPGLSALAVLQE